MEFREEDDGDGAGTPPAPAPAVLHHSTATANRPAPVGMHARESRRQQTQQYHECLRNHAAAAGGHVVDGCCEFMAASPDDLLACAACGCHRSFHRRGDTSPGRAHLPLLAAANTRAPPLLLLPPAPAGKQQRLAPFPYGLAPSAGTTTESSSEEPRGPAPAPRRRSRTTFTREQKEQMLAFAERVGWRMQRQDDASVEQFCAEAGVQRQALKVWMHNNKQSSTGRRLQNSRSLQEHRQDTRVSSSGSHGRRHVPQQEALFPTVRPGKGLN